jgi:hypothetical protein
MPGAAFWTQQEDDELWRLHSQGVSLIRLSVRFKRTRRAVEVRLMRLRKQHNSIGTNAEHNSPATRETELA